MSIKRLLRYFISLIVAIVLLAIILPYAGIPQSHFLPPSWVYQKAQGLVTGQITAKRDEPTNNVFKIGDRMYFFDYTFYALPFDNTPGVPLTKPAKPPKSKKDLQMFTGTVLVNHDTYQAANVGDGVYVRYEKTYPWVNGVANPPVGLGIGEGSNVMSGWLIWAGVALVLGGVFTVLIEHLWVKEDI